MRALPNRRNPVSYLFSLLVACGFGVGAHAESTATKSGNWSDESTWANAAVPKTGDLVTIPAGSEVVLDVSPPALSGMTISGKLRFADTSDLALNIEWIMVHGELEIGTETTPFEHKAAITLTDNVKDEQLMGMGDRGIMLSGGTLTALGGPIYFIRNIVYNAPEGGALKLTANGSGVLMYNNTLLTEAHQMGPASNLHFRNNLMLGQGAWPEVFSVETFTPWSSSDYNGFGAATGPSAFAWAAPAAAVDYEARGERPLQSFATLREFAAATGNDVNSKMIDWSVFAKASPPVAGDPTRVYRADDYDFSLVAQSAAIDAGTALPGITDGFTGSAPDLGAIEFGGAAPACGPRPLQLQP